MINLSRRGFIFGGAAFAIVPAGILMPIKQLIVDRTDPRWPEEFSDEFLPLPAGVYNMTLVDLVQMENKLLAHLNVNGRIIRQEFKYYGKQ